MTERLLFSLNFPPGIGGGESFMLARCRAAPQGLTVIAANCAGSQQFDADQDFAIHRFDFPWSSPSIRPLRGALQLQRTAEALDRQLSVGGYRVVEVSTVLPGGIAGLLPWRRNDFALVSFAYGDDLLQPGQRWYSRLLFDQVLKRVDRFIAISRYTRSLVLDFGVPPERVAIINPPIDRDRFTALADGCSIRTALPPHDLILLTVCRLVRKKGIDRVIEILPRLAQRFPGLLYIVAGTGPDRSRLEALASRVGVSERVQFLGHTPDEDLASVYAAADVFCMPTRLRPEQGEVEGFGIVFLEAGSQKLPVIGPNVGGCPDAIVDGVTGYLVDPNSQEDIQARIEALLSDPGLRRQFGVAGRKRALEPTDWSPLFDL